ncbi:MAG TPA: amidase [Gemmatimonadaceae bacterium]|jgi:amidase|nr:amidase [Gemmatimonadaceae bacterium]
MSEDALSRRAFVGVSAAIALGKLEASRATTNAPRTPLDAPRPTGAPPVPPAPLDDLTITDLQAGLQSGKYTARSLVEQYTARIDSMDKRGPTLNHVLEINPDALTIADQKDAERKAGKPQGPLHGIPILIKDNIDTADRMHTSAGSLVLATSTPSRDSWVAERLRAAGAIILGKTNLSEWANIRSTHSSSGWSGRGGQGKNPYALDRNTSGSSSGSGGGVAASYCAAAIGSETDGSVTSPSAACGLVGIKPTVGLIGRSGIIPISHSQDTAGPMTRTVRDTAILLGALTGIDPRDDATKPSQGKSYSDYTRFLDANGLRGARIGVVRETFMGYSPKTDKLVEQAIDVIKHAGATVVDPANLPSIAKIGDAELEVLLYELKADLNSYLASLGPSAPVKTLADVIRFNEQNAPREMPYFGQELFEQAQKKGPLTDSKYKAARAKCLRYARNEGIDAVMNKYRLDALIAPTQGPVWLIDLVNGDGGGGGSFTQPAAVAGYPHITVPVGLVQGLPVGLSFVGRAWSEPTLLKLAYAYEQASKARRPPTFVVTALSA